MSGRSAEGWLLARGWRALSPDLRIFADAFDADGFGYARTWLSPGRYEKLSTVGSDPSSSVTAILFVEGSAEISVGAHVTGFHVGDVVLVSSASTVTLAADSSVAIYEIVTDYGRMALARYSLPPTSGPHPTSANYWPALTGVINQVLTAPLSADDLGITSVRTAVESLLIASLKESPEMPAQHALADERHHLQRAREIIQNEAHSPDFSVARLAMLARVSRAHLHRVFAAQNSTPLAEIRKRRIDLAHFHLLESDTPHERDLLVVARSSGFQTVAAMRRALRGA